MQQIYYRFDRHFFYVNQKTGTKSSVPYQNEIKFSLPATILMKDCVGKRIYYKSKEKPKVKEELKCETPKKGKGKGKDKAKEKQVVKPSEPEVQEESKCPLKE